MDVEDMDEETHQEYNVSILQHDSSWKPVSFKK